MRLSHCAVLVCVSVLILGVAAWGHKPISIGGVFPNYIQALPVSELDVSQVVYSPLSQANPRLWLVFETESVRAVDVSVGIPFLERLSNYRPSLAILGPGLPDIALPFETPPNLGAIVLSSRDSDKPRYFNEPFTGTESWILIDETVALASEGTHYIVSWSPNAAVDKLWVAIGKREAFGLRDFAAFPSIIRDVRAFHEATEPHWSRTFAKILLLGVIGLSIAWRAF